MSRNGSGVYSLPPGLPSNGDTSDVSDIITPLQDLETDMNTARPIVAGGTGATSAAAARTALGVVPGTAGTTDYIAKWNAAGAIVDGYAFLDEDDMASDSASAAASQQSIKAHVASAVSLVHLSTQTASSSATLNFTQFDSTIYGSYLFVLSNLIPATDDVSLNVRTSANAGSSYDAGASDYEWTGGQAGSSNANSNSSTDEIVLTNNGTGNNVGSGGSEYGVSGEVRVFAPDLTAHTYVRGNLMFKNSVGNIINMDASGTRMATTEVDAIQFLFNSGNIESGTISMYGMRKS